MIDLHCHILPAIDHDGPVSLEESLAMARIAADDGIRQVVATPHLGRDVHSPEVISRLVGHVNRALGDAEIPLQVVAGAENCSSLDIGLLRHYTINGSDYLLLEFPPCHLTRQAVEQICYLRASGLRPIIAHPERNPTVMRRPRAVAEFVEAGALVQITAESLLGGFGPEARECGVFLLKSGQVHFIASDAHSATVRRPVLSRGVRAAARVIDPAVVQRLVLDNPAAVIAGASIHG